MDVAGTVIKGLRSTLRLGGLRFSQSTFPVNPPRAKFDYVPSPRSTHFTVGFAKASLLPPDVAKKKYYVAGYSENNPATGILDAPHIHALWVDDNSSHGGILLFSLDAVGILNADVLALRRRLHDFSLRTHCRCIHITATHNHAGIDTMGIWGPLPFTGRKQSYMDFVFAQAEQCAEKAYAARKNGQIYHGNIHAKGMQEDIRTPVVYSDLLTRLRFVPEDGCREVWFLNFASHSESLQGCNSRISADFPAYLREKIKRDTGADVFYCVGAIGGMITMAIPNEKEIRSHGSDFAENTKQIGYRLADFAQSIAEETRLTPTVSYIRQEFFFEADNTVLMLAAKAGIIKVQEYHIPSAPLRHGLKSEITYMEIGHLQILMLPGELFPELAYGGYLSAEESGTGLGAEVNPLPLTEIAGKDTLIVGLCNDEVGYILPPNDFLLSTKAPYAKTTRDAHGRKHYEETNSLGPATAGKIAEVTAQIMKTVKQSKFIAKE